MGRMDINPNTIYMLRRPASHRITILDTDRNLGYFTHATDCYPEPDGSFRRTRKDYTDDSIPLRGSVFVEEFDEDGDRTGRFDVLTPDEFRGQFTEHTEPYYTYGIQVIARPRDIVEHGTREACQQALDAMPVIREGGTLRIVRQLVTEPGDWEPAE